MENILNLFFKTIETDNPLLLRKVIINNIFLMVATVVLTLSAFLNSFLFSNYMLSIINTISALTAFFGVYILKKHQNIAIAQVISSVNIFVFFILFAYLTQNNDFSLIWTIFAPIFIIPILGHKKGIQVTLLFYTLFFFLAYENLGIWQNGEWNFHSLGRLIASSLVLTYVTYVNEISIFKTNKLLKSKQLKEEQYTQKLIQSRDRAIEAEKSKDSFLSNMSHEIRTPLNAIVGFVQILKKEITNEEHKKHLSIIDASSHSLLALIGDILDFAKLRSGKLDILQKEYDIKKELTPVLELFKQTAADKKILYNVIFKGNFEKFTILDKDRVNQILSNFLSNAIKFTPEMGTIDITVRVEKKTLVISVKDSGIGMNKEQQSRIFQAFEQARKDTTHEYGGTGLGLAISLKLAQLMEGGITVSSELNKGTLFELSLPIEQTHKKIDATTSKSEDALPSMHFSGNILVAEDNKSNQLLITLLLEEMNLNVTMANNGQEAYTLYKESLTLEKRYDLILMDNNMPIMDGIESTQKIKALQNYYNTPIVALTANALKGDREYFLENGMDGYLQKPLEVADLITVLKKLL